MLTHLISIIILSVVPLVRSASSITEEDVNIDVRREHKTKFYEILNVDCAEKALTSNGEHGYWMLSKHQYNATIKLLEDGMSGTTSGTVEYSRRHTLLNSYEVLEIAGIKKIIKKRKDENSNVLYLVPFDDIFDSMYQCHKNIGHKGRDLMHKEIKFKYINITINHINSNFFLIY